MRGNEMGRSGVPPNPPRGVKQRHSRQGHHGRGRVGKDSMTSTSDRRALSRVSAVARAEELTVTGGLQAQG